MALHTLGTNGTTSLNCLRFPGAPVSSLGQAVPSIVIPSAADIASLSAAIKDDMINVNLAVPAGPVAPDALSPRGNPNLLFVPNRGVLKILPGDIVATDPVTGWAILVSYQAVAATGSLWHFV